MKETEPADISRPHDLLVKRFLNEPDLASDLFKNYLAAEWMELVDFDSLKRESTEPFTLPWVSLHKRYGEEPEFGDTILIIQNAE